MRAWFAGELEALGPQVGVDTEVVAAMVAQRRAAAAAVLLDGVPVQGPKGPKRKDPSPFVWEDHVRRFTPAEFKLRYRLTAEAFYELLYKIGDRLSVKNEKNAVNSKGQCEPHPAALPFVLHA